MKKGAMINRFHPLISWIGFPYSEWEMSSAVRYLFSGLVWMSHEVTHRE